MFACSPPAPPQPMPRPEALRRPFPTALLTTGGCSACRRRSRSSDDCGAMRATTRRAGPGFAPGLRRGLCPTSMPPSPAQSVVPTDTFGTTAPTQTLRKRNATEDVLPAPDARQAKEHHLKLLRLRRSVYKLVYACLRRGPFQLRTAIGQQQSSGVHFKYSAVRFKLGT